jgi:hypothetical protein
MSFDRRLTVTIRSAMSSRIIFAVAAAVAATLAASAQAPGPDSVQQLVAMQRAWGPKANSAGAMLTLMEGSRATADGHAVVRYRMITTGLPKDKAYSLLMWQLGGQPQGVVSGITIDSAQTAICAGKVGTCKGDKPDDPVDLAMQAGLGEVKRVALVAEDKSAHAFASIVPFPNRATDGGCTLEATLVTPKSEAVMLSASGFKPGAALSIEMNSEGEIQHPSGKTDANGAYEWVVLPFKQGLTKGRARVSVHSENCNPALSFAWGEGSYVLQ